VKAAWIVWTFAIAALLSVCRPASADGLSDAAKSAAVDANRFAVDLYGQLGAADGKNLVFSPYSIDTALAMTSAGARGRTAQQMAGALHLELPQDKLAEAMANLSGSLHPPTIAGEALPFELVTANALWVQKGFAIVPGFIDVVKDRYGAELDSLDFAGSVESREAARSAINDWVAKRTHDKIKGLIPPGSLDAATRLVLTNAIYFKSGWEAPFEKGQTRDEPFHAGASADEVPMMHQAHQFGYFENEQLQAAELPYRAGSLSMVVLLPKKPDGLGELEKSLTWKNLDTWLAGVAPHEVELSLPKFTFTSHLGLAQTLRAMGMKDAFDADADFSGISSSDRLYVQNVIHQAFIAVDETGTEAAAATAVVMGLMAIREPQEKVVFKADHPFVFLIRDNASGAILFMGRVMNPKA